MAGDIYPDMLNTIITGEPAETTPLVIVHGLFGSARNWNVIAKRLSAGRQIIAVDQRNHGDSAWAAPHDYPSMAADIAEVIRAHGGRADVLGHSMGGKASMVLALQEPELIRRLVVADIAPVVYHHTQQPLIDAMRDLDLTDLTTRGEADKRLAAGVEDPGTRAFLLQSLDLRAEGGPRWKLNLEELERGMANAVGFPEVSGRFGGPALFLSGAESRYVRPEMHARILDLFPNAVFEEIAGAGHWLHAERPREVEAAVEKFLS